MLRVVLLWRCVIIIPKTGDIPILEDYNYVIRTQVIYSVNITNNRFSWRSTELPNQIFEVISTDKSKIKRSNLVAQVYSFTACNLEIYFRTHQGIGARNNSAPSLLTEDDMPTVPSFSSHPFIPLLVSKGSVRLSNWLWNNKKSSETLGEVRAADTGRVHWSRWLLNTWLPTTYPWLSW